MFTLLSPNFVLQEVTENDMVLASICWGFTLGFGFLTTWTAIKQTMHIFKRHRSAIFRNSYVWMIWLEILVCLSFSIICWMFLKGIIKPCFAFYFCILTLWALQVQFLLQIIINRVSILLLHRKQGTQLKYGVAALITAINISVYCIWIPARLQISEQYIHVNNVWDRCEKIIYLLVDAAINFYFMRIVQENLVSNGLTKYGSLVRFNRSIIILSLSMDVLIIAMMSLHNSFVYMQFHPLAYIVKLNIEMSMADLIGKVARQDQNGVHSSEHQYVYSEGTFKGKEEKGTQKNVMTSSQARRITIPTKTGTGDEISDDGLSLELQEITKGRGGGTHQRDMRTDGTVTNENYPSSSSNIDMAVYTTQEVRIEVESAPNTGGGGSSIGDGFDNEGSRKGDDDTRPLRNDNNAPEGGKKAMGIYTKVWGV